MRRRPGPSAMAFVTLGLVAVCPARGASPATAGEIEPLALLPTLDPASSTGLFSERTLKVAIEVDRDAARLIAYAVEKRPYVRPIVTAGRSSVVCSPWSRSTRRGSTRPGGR